MTRPSLTATIHLVRHGEVENPKGVIYGRLPGYNLSERGQRQAEEAGRHLAGRDVGAIWVSPLERAQETAAAVARHHPAVEVVTDERLTESRTTLEGAGRTLLTFLRSPLRWWSLRNPWKPSWGESFEEMRARMIEAIAAAAAAADGREVVIVSHQTPILVARLALGRRTTPPWLARLPCHTGSVTSIELNDGLASVGGYFVPST